MFKLTLNSISVRILAIEDVPLKEFFLGLVRLQDIRRHEVDKIEVEDCFQPGDIIRGRVISLGDSKSFFISTAEPELGVLLGWSEDGTKLLPYTWETLIDPRNGATSKRKVAKPLEFGQVPSS